MCLLMFSGCSATSQTEVEYKTESDAVITVELDEGYTLEDQQPFKILKNKKKIAKAKFVESKDYTKYAKAANAEKNTEVLEQGTYDGNSYLYFASYDDESFNYLINVSGSDCGVLLSEIESEKDAKLVLKAMTITYEK